MLKQALIPEPTPEELLRFCEAEMGKLRQKRGSDRNRALILTAALLLVVMAGVGALFVLFLRLQDLPRPSQHQGALEVRNPAEVAQIDPASNGGMLGTIPASLI